MINMIVATDINRAIGVENQLPWHIKADLQYFKEQTLHHPILMGRKTFESIGRPLPYRTNIVLTRDPHFSAEGVHVIHSIQEAIALFPQYPDLFIIGGGQIYSELLPFVDKLYLTLVETTIKGADTFFPEYANFFTEVNRSERLIDSDSGLAFTFITLERH